MRIASSPDFHERTKNIEVDSRFIREKTTSRYVAISYVKSNDQLVDIFIGSLKGPRIKYTCNKLGRDVTTLRGVLDIEQYILVLDIYIYIYAHKNLVFHLFSHI